MSYSEDDLQKYFAYVLQQACRKTLWFHVPNGGKRDKRTAGMLKKFGLRPGVADMLIFKFAAPPLAVEVKTETGPQSDAQQKFERHWIAVGGIYEIVRNPQEISDIPRRFALD